jgi:MFS family permease
VRNRLGPAFARLWAAATVSNLGDGVTLAAGPLLAARLTDDPRLVAGLAVAQRLPWLLFALVAGALVDRWDRQKVMATANWFRAFALATIAIAAATDTEGLVLLYVVFFTVGIAETFFDNAAQAFMPRLVPAEQLPSANSRLFAGEIVANQFVGPPLGGLLFGLAVAAPFVVDSITFAGAALLIASLPRSPHPRLVSNAARPSLRSDIAEGLRYLMAHRLLRSMAVMLGILNLLSLAIDATLVLLARDRLGLSDAGYGVLLTSGAIGGLAATPFAPRIVRRLGEGGVMVASLWGLAAVGLLVVFTHSAWFVGLYIGISAAIGITWNIATVSLRQRIIPDRLFGRVNSVYRLLAWGTMPIGALIGGVVVAHFGLVAPYWIQIVTLVVCAIIFTPLLNNRRVREAEAAAINDR